MTRHQNSLFNLGVAFLAVFGCGVCIASPLLSAICLMGFITNIFLFFNNYNK